MELSEAHTELQTAQHLLIVGENGEHKSLLFHTVGYLALGRQRSLRPPRRPMIFMPVRAYTLTGALPRSQSPIRTRFDIAAQRHRETSWVDVGFEHLEANWMLKPDEMGQVTKRRQTNHRLCRVRPPEDRRTGWSGDDTLDILVPNIRASGSEESLLGTLRWHRIVDVGHDVPEAASTVARFSSSGAHGPASSRSGTTQDF